VRLPSASAPALGHPPIGDLRLLNPIEMLWRQFCREVTQCELFASIDAMVKAARAFFGRYDGKPGSVWSMIEAYPIRPPRLYSVLPCHKIFLEQ
jgi:hypothetical protein